MTAQRHPFTPTDRTLRQFAGLWIVFFGALAGLQRYHHQREVAAIVLAVLAITIGPVGIGWPRLMRPIFIGWMALVYPVGWVISRLVLGVVFYGIFTPVSWGLRLAGRDALTLKQPPDAATYWHPKPSATDKWSYLRQF